jgi:hypothetical protein
MKRATLSILWLLVYHRAMLCIKFGDSVTTCPGDCSGINASGLPVQFVASMGASRGYASL